MNKLIQVPRLTLLLALIVSWLLPQPNMDGEIPERPFADSRFGEIDGVRVHWRERALDAPADRPLVVLVHGFGGSTFSWRHTLDALEQSGYPAVAVDLPPFGYSQRTGDGPSWAQLVRNVSERVAPDRDQVVVGHSMGAGVAARIAAAEPDRLRLVVFGDGTPGLRDGDGLPLGWALQITPVREAAEAWASWQLLDKSNIEQSLASAFGRAPTEAELAGYYHPLTIPETFSALLTRLNRRDGRKPEGWERVPLAVVWGEKDAWVPIERIRPWLEDHPNLQAFDTLPGAAHNPMDTHPEAFNTWLLEQLQAGQ